MVSFSTDDEKYVYNNLIKINPRLADIYYSGLLVLRQKKTTQTAVLSTPFSKTNSDNDSQIGLNSIPENSPEENPDRIAQSAHSMRELLNVALRDSEIASSFPNLTFKRKIQKMSDPQSTPHISNESTYDQSTYDQSTYDQSTYDQSTYDQSTYDQSTYDQSTYDQPILPIHLESTYEQLTSLHKWFTKVSHHPESVPSEKNYDDKLLMFNSLMCHILTSHYDVIKEIDKLIELEKPEKKDLEKLESLMDRTQAYNYFFINAKDNWLEILVQHEKYFKDIPPVIKKGNSYSFPFWPESHYLKRCASKKPELIQKIILDICVFKKDLEKNPTVLWDFVNAALKMSPALGKLIAKKAIKEKWCVPTSSSTLGRVLADLMIRLIESEFETSLQLCDFLLDVTIVDFEITDIFSPQPSQILYGVIDNYSYEEILKNDISSLSDKDHNAVIQILSEKLSKANHLVNKSRLDYAKDPNEDMSIYWRPAIEISGRNHNFDLRSHLVTGIHVTLEKSESMGIDSLVKSLKILSKYKNNIFRRLEIFFYGKYASVFIDEINRISVEYFGNNAFKHEYYYMLKNGYPYLKSEIRKKISDNISKGPDFNNFNGNKDEFEIYKKHWKIDVLSPIIEYLDDFKKEYNSLVEQCRSSDLIESHKPIFPVSQPSNLTEDMSVEQVMLSLKSYQIQKDISLLEDETGKIFKKFVEKNPGIYSQHATELIDSPEPFHFRFLDGLSKIKDVKLDWDSILTFCEYVIITSPSKETRILDLILDCLGNLLRNSLRNDQTGISFTLRDRVWKILKKAIEIASPDTTWSKNYPDGHESAYGISINSNIGILSYILIQYASWCYYGLKEMGSAPTELVPEVKSLLESMLNPEHKQSISIHAVLGHQFYNLLALDDEWTKSKINLIFTHDEQHAKAGIASWDAYISQQLYEGNFDILFDEYLYRIKHLYQEKTVSSNDYRQQFAQQIGLIYLSNLNKSDDLFEYFLKKSDPQSIGDCLEWIGRALKDWKAETPPKMNISKLLSYSKIKSNTSVGWLFLNPLMSKSERIKLLNSILDETKVEILLTHLILKELESFAKEYPLETIECVSKIIKHYQVGTSIYVMKSFESIFPLILETKDESAIEKMYETIHFLGSLGYEEFRKFLS